MLHLSLHLSAEVNDKKLQMCTRFLGQGLQYVVNSDLLMNYLIKFILIYLFFLSTLF